MIVVVDYGMGNLGSVQRSLKKIKAESIISSDPMEIEKAKKIILPGVGNFANAMNKINDTGLLGVLNKKVLEQNIPVLGICLGMQLFATFSEEGNAKGLGWIEAEVRRFNVDDPRKWKIPHMSMNSLIFKKKNEIMKNVSEEDFFYFVHSYHMICKNSKDILSSSSYCYEFISSINKGNIYGTQFHPEKSHDAGLKILENFSKLDV